MPARTAARYDDDVYTWSQQQARALRRAAASRVNVPDPIDFANVAEEIESLGISQQRDLYSRCVVLLMHLLKWQYLADERMPGWRMTIITQRDEINDLLERSPGLKSKRSAESPKDYHPLRPPPPSRTSRPTRPSRRGARGPWSRWSTRRSRRNSCDGNVASSRAQAP
jgi:hypothetical protein